MLEKVKLKGFRGDLGFLHKFAEHHGGLYWPGGASSIFLDPGVSLARTSWDIILKAYTSILTPEQLHCLDAVRMRTGDAARSALEDLATLDIKITLEQSIDLLPVICQSHWDMACKNWPGLAGEDTPPSVQTAVLSVCCDRGANKPELRVFKAPIAAKNWRTIGKLLVDMQQGRNSGRRRAEGNLILKDFAEINADEGVLDLIEENDNQPHGAATPSAWTRFGKDATEFGLTDMVIAWVDRWMLDPQMNRVRAWMDLKPGTTRGAATTYCKKLSKDPRVVAYIRSVLESDRRKNILSREYLLTRLRDLIELSFGGDDYDSEGMLLGRRNPDFPAALKAIEIGMKHLGLHEAISGRDANVMETIGHRPILQPMSLTDAVAVYTANLRGG